MITQDELKAILNYNPLTGVFRWLVDVGNKPTTGDIAGGLDPAGYRRISINYKKYKEHRLAFLYMTGSFPSAGVDHRNRVTDDNRWVNLRRATAQQNNENTIRNTPVLGVTFNKACGKWMARGRRTIDTNHPYLGLYVNYEDAVNARLKWEEDLIE